MTDDMATLTYRMGRFEDEQRRHADEIDRLDTQATRHEEQISGAGGLIKAMEALGGKVDSLNKALWGFAGSFILAAVTIAIAILQQKP